MLYIFTIILVKVLDLKTVKLIWDINWFNYFTKLDQIITTFYFISCMLFLSLQPVVYMELKFPKSYPMEPPFARVIRPRFKFLTGM